MASDEVIRLRERIQQLEQQLGNIEINLHFFLLDNHTLRHAHRWHIAQFERACRAVLPKSALNVPCDHDRIQLGDVGS